MNKYVYSKNTGYKKLDHKYNVNPYYSYKWLSDNKNSLTEEERKELDEYENYINKYNYNKYAMIEGTPVIRHFYGADKPWTTYTQRCFKMPYTPHFEDFWFYAKMTPYFEDLKEKFISRQMYTQPADTTVQTGIEKQKTIETPFYKNSLQRIFSVKNQVNNSKKYKIITIAGAKIKLKLNK